MHPKHSLLQSFGFAIDGYKEAFRRGRNFRIQNTIGLLAITLAVILHISYTEWVGLILISAMVLILELINTSIEAIVDMVSPEIRPSAKLAKDISAASVLVASCAAFTIGIFLFLPKILK